MSITIFKCINTKNVESLEIAIFKSTENTASIECRKHYKHKVKKIKKMKKLKNWKDLGAFADIMNWNVENTGSRAFVEMMKQEVDTML